jgi:hypothetical protein
MNTPITKKRINRRLTMGETINTLQEFMTQTKGVIYILAIAYLIGFTCFWKFLHRRGDEDEA